MDRDLQFAIGACMLLLLSAALFMLGILSSYQKVSTKVRDAAHLTAAILESDRQVHDIPEPLLRAVFPGVLYGKIILPFGSSMGNPADQEGGNYAAACVRLPDDSVASRAVRFDRGLMELVSDPALDKEIDATSSCSALLAARS